MEWTPRQEGLDHTVPEQAGGERQVCHLEYIEEAPKFVLVANFTDQPIRVKKGCVVAEFHQRGSDVWDVRSLPKQDAPGDSDPEGEFVESVIGDPRSIKRLPFLRNS